MVVPSDGVLLAAAVLKSKTRTAHNAADPGDGLGQSARLLARRH